MRIILLRIPETLFSRVSFFTASIESDSRLAEGKREISCKQKAGFNSKAYSFLVVLKWQIICQEFGFEIQNGKKKK